MPLLLRDSQNRALSKGADVLIGERGVFALVDVLLQIMSGEIGSAEYMSFKKYQQKGKSYFNRDAGSVYEMKYEAKIEYRGIGNFSRHVLDIRGHGPDWALNEMFLSQKKLLRVRRVPSEVHKVAEDLLQTFSIRNEDGNMHYVLYTKKGASKFISSASDVRDVMARLLQVSPELERLLRNSSDIEQDDYKTQTNLNRLVSKCYFKRWKDTGLADRIGSGPLYIVPIRDDKSADVLFGHRAHSASPNDRQDALVAMRLEKQVDLLDILIGTTLSSSAATITTTDTLAADSINRPHTLLMQRLPTRTLLERSLGLWLANSWSEGKPWMVGQEIVVLVPLNILIKSNRLAMTLAEIVVTFCMMSTERNKPDELVVGEYLDKHQAGVLVVFDGFEEVVAFDNEERRKECMDFVSALMMKYASVLLCQGQHVDVVSVQSSGQQYFRVGATQLPIQSYVGNVSLSPEDIHEAAGIAYAREIENDGVQSEEDRLLRDKYLRFVSSIEHHWSDIRLALEDLQLRPTIWKHTIGTVRVAEIRTITGVENEGRSGRGGEGEREKERERERERDRERDRERERERETERETERERERERLRERSRETERETERDRERERG